MNQHMINHWSAISSTTYSAVAAEMGYKVPRIRIRDCMNEFVDLSTIQLRNQLYVLNKKFQKDGGRGVELAERIDRLRIALAARG